MLESPLCRQFAGLMQALAEIGSPPIRAIATPAGNIGTAASGADCNAALMALNASMALASKAGERVLSYEEMFSSPSKSALRRDELIREIRIPVNKAAASAFNKLAKRKAQDIAQVSACVCLEAEGGICKKATVALGAVASRTVRAKSMEELIVNKNIDAAVSSLKGFVPSEASLRSPRNKFYKERVIGILVGRALKMAHAEIAGRN
jgi:CO/xanthine dehydrogenase FAD-binding subunit